MNTISNYIHFLWRKHIEPKDPYSNQFKLALKTCIAAFIAIGFVFYFQPPEMEWCVIAAIFTMLMYLGDTWQRALLTQAGFGLILLSAIAISTLAGPHFITYLILLCVVTLAAFSAFKYGVNIAKPALFVLALAILSSNTPIPNWLAFGYRELNAAIGVIIALLVSNFLWPYSARTCFNRHLKKNLGDIRQYIIFVLQDTIRGNFHRPHQYELKEVALKSLQRCRELIQYYPSYQNRLMLHEHFYQLAIALSDMLNKPNSEYSLELMMEKLSDIALFLNCSIKLLTREKLDQLKTTLHTFADEANNPNQLKLILNDIRGMTFLFREIYFTLEKIHETL